MYLIKYIWIFFIYCITRKDNIKQKSDFMLIAMHIIELLKPIQKYKLNEF